MLHSKLSREKERERERERERKWLSTFAYHRDSQ
jgi:hypothetical protein